MGLFNWLLKNGPGSPGSTASAFIKLYEQADVSNHREEWEGAFFMVFMARYHAYQRMGFPGGCLIDKVDANQLIQNSQGDLPLFIFSMMHFETAAFRNNAPNNLLEVTEVIYEVVKKNKSSAIVFDLPIFQRKSQQFVF